MSVGSNGQPPTRVNCYFERSKQRIYSILEMLSRQTARDKCDVESMKGSFVPHVNQLNRLSVVFASVKGKLLRTYCCSWYGCQTWYLVSKSAESMVVKWNQAVRRTIGTQRPSHCFLGPLLLTWFNLIPECISNHMPSKVWNEITDAFLNFNGCSVGV